LKRLAEKEEKIKKKKEKYVKYAKKYAEKYLKKNLEAYQGETCCVCYSESKEKHSCPVCNYWVCNYCYSQPTVYCKRLGRIHIEYNEDCEGVGKILKEMVFYCPMCRYKDIKEVEVSLEDIQTVSDSEEEWENLVRGGRRGRGRRGRRRGN
jgi:hypothetical protein